MWHKWRQSEAAFFLTSNISVLVVCTFVKISIKVFLVTAHMIRLIATGNRVYTANGDYCLLSQ